MATTAIDTNALIALVYDDEAYAAASEEAIRDTYRDGRLVVSPVVYVCNMLDNFNKPGGIIRRAKFICTDIYN